jgi:RNA polymerase sigma-70 factor (ECF subfamily)
MDRAANLGTASAVELVPHAREPFRGKEDHDGGAGSAPPPKAPVADLPPVADLADAVRRAQEGDEDAFRVLYRDLQPRFLRYLRAIVGDDADDVASETWLHIARGLSAFHGDSDGFRGWAATIARHRATDHFRQHQRRAHTVVVPVEELAHLAGTDDTAGSALDSMSTDAAIALIARLPPDQAEAVLLRVVMGLDAKGAAIVLGKRAGAVRTAAYRGLRGLAGFLGE